MTLPTQSASTAEVTHSANSLQVIHASSSSQGADEGPDSHDVDAPYIAPAGAQSSSAPSRYCSVKGCKATIPGDYFFKMCEPCRDRYRGYGITKRAKSRAERVAANAELEALRVEEDKRRADEGLPVRILTCYMPYFYSDCVRVASSLLLKAPKTGSPGKTTSSKDRFSPKLRINMAPSPHACALSPIAMPSSRDSTNTVVASSTGCRTDIIAS